MEAIDYVKDKITDYIPLILVISLLISFLDAYINNKKF